MGKFRLNLKHKRRHPDTKEEEREDVDSGVAAAVAKKRRRVVPKSRVESPTKPLAPAPTSGPSSLAVQYNIREFDPSTIRDYSTILVAGGRRTGKSFCARDLLWWLKHRVYDCYVYSGTVDEDHPWDKYTPEKYVQYVETEFPDAHLQHALDVQSMRKDIAKKHSVACPPTLLMFEDLEFLKKSMWKNQSIRTVMFNGRWRKCFAIAAVQYIMEIDMAVRSMFDYAIFTMCPVVAVRERIWKQYAGIFPTFDEFEAAFAMCTANHNCMVIDCRATSYKVEDTVFYYKASDRGFFHIGVEDVWDPEVDEANRVMHEEVQQAAPPVTKKRSRKELQAGGIGVTLQPKDGGGDDDEEEVEEQQTTQARPSKRSRT